MEYMKQKQIEKYNNWGLSININKKVILHGSEASQLNIDKYEEIAVFKKYN